MQVIWILKHFVLWKEEYYNIEATYPVQHIIDGPICIQYVKINFAQALLAYINQRKGTSKLWSKNVWVIRFHMPYMQKWTAKPQKECLRSENGIEALLWQGLYRNNNCEE